MVIFFHKQNPWSAYVNHPTVWLMLAFKPQYGDIWIMLLTEIQLYSHYVKSEAHESPDNFGSGRNLYSCM